MTRIIVLLGAGMTGLPLAHYVLKHYVDKHDLKLVLVSQSEEFYWNIAAPRLAVPGQFTNDQVFSSIPQAFAKYPSNRFEFVLGTVAGWNPDQKSVNVAINKEHNRIVNYYTIIIATGSHYNDGMPWKLIGTSEQTQAALADLRDKVKAAKSIMVGGGGPTGIEVAGELGYEYAKAGQKKVTLVMSDALPLDPRIMDVTRNAARKELEKLNVNIVANTRITTITTSKDGQTTLELTHGDGTTESHTTDLFLPSWGIKFNTSFVPTPLLEADRRITVNKTLRIPGYDNAFALGDAANLESYSAGVRELQVRYLATALGQYFDRSTLSDFVPADKVGMTVSVGRGRGIGQLFGWNVWSLLVWFFKSRHMATNAVPGYVAGTKLILGSF